VSDDAERRGEMPAEYSSRMEEAWERAIAEGDTGFALEDFELHMEALFLDGRVYRGVEGLRQWRREIEELSEYDRFDVRAVRQRDDVLVLIGRLYIKGRGSGAEVDLPFVHVVKRRVDKVVRLTMYSDVERALAEAGVS
jgi:hypothetical protein